MGELCEEILDTLKVLEPGMTVRVARIMFELHLPLLMLAQISLNKHKPDKATVKKQFHKGLVMLKLALKVFEAEPDGSWERLMVQESQGTLTQVKEIIQEL